jgi:hypothetical protein
MAAKTHRPTIRFRFLTVWICALMAACTTLQVPTKAPVFQEKQFLHATRAGMDIAACPIVTAEEYWQLFDDYLPKLGIAAVWIRVRNQGEHPVAVNPETWLLRAENRNHAVLKIPELFGRYYSARGIRMYGIRGDQAARRDLGRIRLNPARLAPDESCEGFLFFEIDPGDADLWYRGAFLVARDIELSGGAKVVLEIALSHASP